MYIFELVQTKLDVAIQELTKLVEHYSHLDDAALMDKTALAFDNIRSCLKFEANILAPVLDQRLGTDPNIRNALASVRGLNDRIESLMERQTMVHVDEPEGFFLNRQRELLGMLGDYRQLTVDYLHGRANEVLTDKEKGQIQMLMEQQMQEESIPSKGLEIY